MRKVKGKPPGIVLSSDRDMPLLHFLWKWKVATTSALAQRFYPTITSEGAYRRLWRLERMGIIVERFGRSRHQSMWALGAEGFRLIKPLLPGLREDGYKSECVGHDLLASAVHLGDWYLSAPDDVELVSEQELRRYEIDEYPDWVPTDMAHRPDGYWNIPNGPARRTIALEVELSRQRRARHMDIAEFYVRNRKIIRVLWIVNGKRAAKLLGDRLDAQGSTGFHDFALVDDVLQLGWGAPIVLGPDAGQRIRQLLVSYVSTTSPSVDKLPTLDTRKSPYRSTRSRVLVTADLSV